jgi:hypothetical protein
VKMKAAHAYGNFSSGAVSLFSVVFAILLMSIITISFVRLMVDDQSRASDADLSQSAYDSAQAGVEDAKRALVWCRNNATACENAGYATCNAVIRRSGVVRVGAGAPGSTGEVQIQSVAGTDGALNQAYSCVTIDVTPEDYVETVTANQSAIIPLLSDQDFDMITIEWFNREDVKAADGTVQTPDTGDQPLYIQDQWHNDQPSLLRAQFMQFDSNFTLNQLDYLYADGQSNANTVFLYPQQRGFRNTTFATDVRQTESSVDRPDLASNTPLPARCATTVSAGGYACKVTLRLPNVVGGAARPQAAYLRLTALYNSTHFRITLGDGENPGARFRNVQANIDSTGRASDLYRRVQSRVNLQDTSFPYPEAAVDVGSDFCKNFGVTNEEYIDRDTTCNDDGL